MSNFILRPFRALRSLPTRIAFRILKRAIQKDPGYAWSWHCNIAMPAHDRGLDHLMANRASAVFMRLAFDVDMTKEPAYKHILKIHGVTS